MSTNIVTTHVHPKAKQKRSGFMHYRDKRKIDSMTDHAEPNQNIIAGKGLKGGGNGSEMELKVKFSGTGSTYKAAHSDHTHPLVTRQSHGFLSNEDKIKLDGIKPEARPNQKIVAGSGLRGGGSKDLVTLEAKLAGSGTSSSAAKSDHIHPVATTDEKGLLSPSDKAKLDSIQVGSRPNQTLLGGPGISIANPSADEVSISVTFGGITHAYGDPGSLDYVSRVDHSHAMATGSRAGFAIMGSSGHSSFSARSDHIHLVTPGSITLANIAYTNGITHTMIGHVITIEADFGGTGSTPQVAHSDHTHPLATETSEGFFSASDKTKINTIIAGAKPNQDIVAGIGLDGGGSGDSVPLQVNFSGTGVAETASRSDHIHSISSPSCFGFMSVDDKIKLDAIETGAQTNFVITTSPSIIKSESEHVVDLSLNFSANGSSLLVARADHGHAVATTTTDGFMSDADKVKLDSLTGTGQPNQNIVAGIGLTGGGNSNVVTLDLSFAGSGSAETASRSDHAHTEYSTIGHAHTEYSLSGHTHSEYVTSFHLHTEYSTIGHIHSENTTIGHIHTEYSTIGHLHTEYSTIGHIHSENTTIGHLHTEYSTIGHIHSVATTFSDGFFSAADKEKLDAIAFNSTPNQDIIAGLGLSGGGNTDTVTIDIIFAGSGTATTASRSDHVHSVATTIADGFFSTTDKEKLDAIAANSTPNQNIVAGDGILGGGQTDVVTIELDYAGSSGVSTSVSRADHTHPGLLSAPQKLDLTDGGITSLHTHNVTSFLVQRLNTIEVAKEGTDYELISTALASITDNSSSKPYLILVHAGEYTDSFTMKPYVYIKGINRHATVLNLNGNIEAIGYSGLEFMTIRPGDYWIDIDVENFSLEGCRLENSGSSTSETFIKLHQIDPEKVNFNNCLFLTSNPVSTMYILKYNIETNAALAINNIEFTHCNFVCDTDTNYHMFSPMVTTDTLPKTASNFHLKDCHIKLSNISNNCDIINYGNQKVQLDNCNISIAAEDGLISLFNDTWNTTHLLFDERGACVQHSIINFSVVNTFDNCIFRFYTLDRESQDDYNLSNMRICNSCFYSNTNSGNNLNDTESWFYIPYNQVALKVENSNFDFQLQQECKFIGFGVGQELENIDLQFQNCKLNIEGREEITQFSFFNNQGSVLLKDGYLSFDNCSILADCTFFQMIYYDIPVSSADSDFAYPISINNSNVYYKSNLYTTSNDIINFGTAFNIDTLADANRKPTISIYESRFEIDLSVASTRFDDDYIFYFRGNGSLACLNSKFFLNGNANRTKTTIFFLEGPNPIITGLSYMTYLFNHCSFIGDDKVRHLMKINDGNRTNGELRLLANHCSFSQNNETWGYTLFIPSNVYFEEDTTAPDNKISFNTSTFRNKYSSGKSIAGTAATTSEIYMANCVYNKDLENVTNFNTSSVITGGCILSSEDDFEAIL